MSSIWQVQEARNRLSELLERAAVAGPQIITRHGRPIAKVVALDGNEAAKASIADDGFTDFLLNMPKLPDGLAPLPRANRSGSPFDDVA